MSKWRRACGYVLGIVAGTVALAGSAQAQDAATEAPAIKQKLLVTNLENPSGVVVHPGTGHVFVASRYGVYRYDPEKYRCLSQKSRGQRFSS